MNPDILTRLKDITRPTGTEDLLAVSYPRPRLHISLKQSLMFALVLVVSVAIWVMFKADSTPSSATALVNSQQTLEETELVVSVIGHVEHPGLVQLPSDSRVADAIEAAGVFPDADLHSLNLAQVLNDGIQIAVYPAGAVPTVNAVSGLISLNSATASELTALPGVGEKTAQAIVDYRSKSGGFTSVEDLKEIKGIGEAKFQKIAPEVSL